MCDKHFMEQATHSNDNHGLAFRLGWQARTRDVQTITKDNQTNDHERACSTAQRKGDCAKLPFVKIQIGAR